MYKVRPGFPMIQQDVFDGKRICLSTITGADGKVLTAGNVQKPPLGGDCSSIGTKCGTGDNAVCVPQD
jgi:hypothetical protein